MSRNILLIMGQTEGPVCGSATGAVYCVKASSQGQNLLAGGWGLAKRPRAHRAALRAAAATAGHSAAHRTPRTTLGPALNKRPGSASHQTAPLGAEGSGAGHTCVNLGSALTLGDLGQVT